MDTGKGVYFLRDKNRWSAWIYVMTEGKRCCIGCFPTEAEAIAAREKCVLAKRADPYADIHELRSIAGVVPRRLRPKEIKPEPLFDAVEDRDGVRCVRLRRAARGYASGYMKAAVELGHATLLVPSGDQTPYPRGVEPSGETFRWRLMPVSLTMESL